MGIEYRAVIVVGLPYEALEGEWDYNRITEAGLSAIAPYFDCPLEDQIVGVVIGQSRDYCLREISLDELSPAAKDALVKFKSITGQDAKTYLTPYGW